MRLKDAIKIGLFALLALLLPVGLRAQTPSNLNAQPEANLGVDLGANLTYNPSVYVDPAANPGATGGAASGRSTVQMQMLRQRPDRPTTYPYMPPPSLPKMPPAGAFASAAPSQAKGSFGSPASSVSSPIALPPYPTRKATSHLGRASSPARGSGLHTHVPHVTSRTHAPPSSSANTPNS